MFCIAIIRDLLTIECFLSGVYVPIFFSTTSLKIFVIIHPGQDFTHLILVKVFAVSEYIGHSSLAYFFRGVISGMNALRNITVLLGQARDVIMPPKSDG